MRLTKISIFSLLCLSFLTLQAIAQPTKVVTWKISTEKAGDDTFNINATATIAAGWHMYDQQEYVDGPNPTRFAFELPEGVAKIGETASKEKPIRVQDEMFGMEIGYYEKSVTFVQKVKLSVPKATVVVRVEWMSCNDNTCTPPQEYERKLELEATVPTLSAAPKVSVSPSAKENQPTVKEAIAGANPSPAQEIPATTVAPSEVETAGAVIVDAAVQEIESEESSSLWMMILEAIIWGFAALLTPCVFPMVPMTVSFFLKGSENRAIGKFRALMYGLFIILLYTLPIAVIIITTRVVGGDAVTADIFNWLATHWLPNILFFIVFMVFAASFFGAFEIVLPSKLVNSSDQQADKKKGLGGVFFLSLTLVLVSFSCTGPIVGTVLIKSTSGEFWAPIVTMFAFSVAFALPFMLFALFPSMLKNLPKSGGWLNSVKVVLGFVEVALGFKFLSTADQVYHWGLLDREVYLAIWIVCFTLLGLYLLGKLKLKYDSDLKYVGVFRLVLAIICFTFVVYMVPGMWGAPLKALSGYLPPMETQDFVLTAGGGHQITLGDASSQGQKPTKVKYGDFLKLPHGIDGFFDLEEAEAYAVKVGKPIFIDFTGHGCVNCREMESRVWSDPRILSVLKNDYVVCALYSDDKIEVPKENWVTLDNGKVLKTLGKINSHFALTEYGVNAQPYYVLQGKGGEKLATRGYDLDVDGFLQWLEGGLEAYGK